MWQFEFQFSSETSRILEHLYLYYDVDPLSKSKAYFFVNSKEIVEEHILSRASLINVFNNPYYKNGLLIPLSDLSLQEYVKLYLECGTRELYAYTIFLPDCQKSESENNGFVNKLNNLSKKYTISFCNDYFKHNPILKIFPEIILLVSSGYDGMDVKISSSLDTSHLIFRWSLTMLTKSAGLDEEARTEIYKKCDFFSIPHILYSGFRILV